MFSMQLNGAHASSFASEGTPPPLSEQAWARQPPSSPHMAFVTSSPYGSAVAYSSASSTAPPDFGGTGTNHVEHALSVPCHGERPMLIMMDTANASSTPNSYYTGPRNPAGFTIVNMDQSNGRQPQPQQLLQRPMLKVVPMRTPPQGSQLQSFYQQQQQQQRRSHDVHQWGFAVVDQLHPLLPRVPLPPSAIAEETRGVSLYNNNVLASSTRPCTSQVCLLYAHTGCGAGRECVSFHVDPEYLALSRAVSQPLCCALHNCFYSHEMLKSDCTPGIIHRAYCISLDTAPAFAVGIGSPSSPRLTDVSLLHLSMTVGLETLPVQDGKVIISLRRQICRLHLEGRCKWTKDCGHVHICRELLPALGKRAVLDFLDAVPSEKPERIVRLLQGSADVRSYMQSAAALPMVAQLLLHGSHQTLAALLTVRVACVRPQLARLQQLGLARSEWDVTVLEVSPKLLPYLAQ